MTTQLVIAALILVFCVELLIFAPMLGKKRGRRRDDERTSVTELEDQLSQTISSVRDLDFDFDTGKVMEADYMTHRKALIGRGVSILIHLDQARAQDFERDDEIEALIAQYRQENT